MNFTEKYTTEAIKAEVQVDKDATPEEKEVENKKIVLNNDAFALCEVLEKLNRRLDILRL